MDKETSLEIRRQIFHAAVGLVSVILIANELVDWKFFLLLLLAGVLLSIFSVKRKLPLISWFLENFERKNAFPGQGALFLVAGILAAFLLFEKDIALASIMIVTLGDSVSHAFGRLFGKIKHPLNKYKLVEGSLLGFIAAAIGASLFVVWPQAVLASAIAMLVESFELKHRRVDDNLLIPLVAGAVIFVMRM
ncbi:hypothetical protein CMO88_00070 [Candidatus Woesearchaeota archaeon]|nr:hypothetical protein [Candidatus Woesearchaeota archaeon]|tara:strand:- start:16425 stop:17000 length:576 start_codon:yes stop_codon:yes gene_type:complete